MRQFNNTLEILWRKSLYRALLFVVGLELAVQAQGALPIVAIHDSELTRALESMPASGSTPTGSGTTGNQWWITQWHYFVMPDSVKEMLRSDGTTFTVVGDSNIVAGVLTNADGSPKYPIVISLASEAVQDSEIAPLTNYVAAGGFLFVGSSAFTRNPDGTTRTNFALASAMGVNMVNPGLTNWGFNSTFTKLTNHLLVSHFPEGMLYWQMPSWSDETTVPQSALLTAETPDETPPITLAYMAWQVRAGDAVAIAEGDVYSNLFVKPFGKGYFIYYAPLEPLIGHGGWAPSTYAYSIFRNAIQWAFQSENLPVVKVSPWPYPYQAAVMFRHDMEAIPSLINSIESSAQFEKQNGAKGEYYFCTGTLREDYSPSAQVAEIASLKGAITNSGAIVSSHNGGLTNIDTYVPPLPIIELFFGSDPDWYTSDNPYYDIAYGLIPTDYSYWHWGPDEVLDSTNLPSGFTSGTQYALTSISNSFSDLERWGVTNGNNVRTWVSPDFDATREPSYQIAQELGIKTTGEEKLGPFPSWVLSTETNDYRYPFITLPPSDWFIGSQIGQSIETGHTIFSVQKAVDYFYNLGALVNLYGHSSSAGNAGGAGDRQMEYVTYAMNSHLHPRLWAANAQDIYAWWLQRSNVQITAATFSTNAGQSQVTIMVSGATDTNTAVEVLAPSVSFTVDQVFTNGVPASNSVYWINGQVIKLLIGNSVTNATINYTLLPFVTNAFYSAQEAFPLTVAAPGVLTGANPGQNGGNLTATMVGGPHHGALSFNSDGSFTYTSSNNFIGFDSFTYQAAAGALTSSVATVTIDVNPPGGLFYDNFMRPPDSSNSISPWILEVGTWTMTNGLMQGTADAGKGGYGGAYIDNPGWTDYVAQAQIQFSTTSANLAGLGGRLDPVSGAHYAAWVFPEESGGGSNILQLVKFTSWTDIHTFTGYQQVLGRANLSSVGTNWHTLTLAFHGTNIFVYFDNQLKISTNDPTSPLTNGGIIMDMLPYPSTFTLGVSNVIVTTLPVTAYNDSYSATENTTLAVAAPGVLGNDLGTNLTAILVTGPTNGVLALNSDGSFTYTPDTNYIGTDTFTYQASNGQTNSNIATVSFNITPFVANNDSYSMVENTTLSMAAPGVLANDTGGTNLTAILVSGPTHGVLTLNSDGSFTYTPDNNYIGTDSFAYQANNGQINSDVATVTINITLDPPAANNDVYAILENSPLTVSAPGVLANDTGGSGPLTAILANGTANGTLTLNADGAFNYMPGTNFAGIDSFTYQATDGSLTSSVAMATIDVTPPGDLFYDTFARSSSSSNSLLPWIVYDGTWAIAGGQLQGQSPNGNYGNIYVNNTNWTDYSVQAQVQFSTANGWGGGIGGRLDPTTGAHYAAWIYPDGSGGGPNVLKLIKFDTWTTYTIMQTADLPSVGTGLHALTLSLQGTDISVTVDGTLEISTTDSSPFTSGGISVDMATVGGVSYTLGISNVIVTMAPVLANNDSYTVPENTTLTVGAPGVLANDLGSDLTAMEVSGPTNGVLTLNSDGSFTYTPDTNYIGTDTFTYQASNGQTNSNIATVSLAVTTNPVVANNQNYNAFQNSVLTVGAPGVLTNDTGGSGALSAILASGTSGGTLSLNPNGGFTYTPSNNFVGLDAFTYQATDGTTTSSVATVTIMVTPPGDLFYDNFVRPTNVLNSLYPWIVYDGTWTIAGGELQGQSPDNNYGNIYVDNTNWTDYSVQAQVQFSTTDAWGGGIGGRLDPTTGAHYAAWLYPDGSGGGPNVLKLFKFTDWTTYTLMQTASLSAVGTGLHTLTMTLQGTNISVSLDGTLEISTNDASPFTNGGITVDMATVGTAYTLGVSNITVTSLLQGQIIDFGPLSNKTYGDAPFTVSATASSGLPVSFSILSGPAIISSNTITITGAGTVTVQASQAGNDSYQAATNVYQTFTVFPASVTITSGLSANSKPYDGTATATISSNNVALSGVLGGDAANVRLNTNGYTANFTSAAAGTGIGVTVSGLTLSGTAAGNYTLTQPSGLSADITALGVTITSGLSANSKPYDGTTAATISSNNVALSGVLGGDAANVRLNTNGYTANFTSAAAGTGIGVTVSGLTLSGTAASNYTLTQPSGLSANITALGVTITSGLSANSKPYDGTATATISSNNVALSGVLGGDAANVRLNTNGYTANFTSAAAGTGVGVTVSGLTLSGTAAGNYTLTQPSGLSANITALGVTITSGLSANSKPYDGTTAATISSNNVALSGVLGGDAANVRLNTNGYTANFTSAGAGTGVGVTVSGLTLSGTAAGNYTLTQPSGLSANITALGVTITSGLSANSKPYDGTATATISSNNVALSGVLGGDAANVRLNTNGYTANFTSAGAGTGVGVTVSGLTLSGTAAGNYTLTQPSGLSADITALGVTITSGLSANSKPYDGTATATISSNNVALSGVLGGDAANVRLNTNGYTANFTSAAAGTGVGVTVSGLTLSGTAAGNYTLTQPSGLSANITALGVTITSGLSANSKPYDGTATATISSNNVALSGVLGGDAANVRLNTNGYTANFTSAAAGTGIGVTVSGLTLSGTAAGNYTLTQPSGLSANITALGVTITSGLSANSKPYDGTTAATISSNNVALSGVLGGDAANVRLNTNGYTANFTSAAAGTGIGVTVSGLTLSGTAAGNYTLTQPSGLSANITALGVTITSGLSANSKPYDGTTAATISSNNVALSGVLGGDAANVRLNTNGYTANFTSAAAGTGIGVTVSGLTLSGTAAGNYTLTQPSGLSANITALGVTITSGLSANSKPYDGTTAATISSNNVALSGVLGGDAANVRLNTNGYTANFTSAAAGTGVGVTVSGLTLSGTAAGNYTLTQPSGLSANITALGVTITSGLSANSKPYDGTTAATISSNNVALSGVLGGDAANVRLNTNGYTANFTSAGAGTGVGVTVSGLTLSGTAAGNYTLTQPSGLSANITALGVTITSGLSANSKPYDGTATATISSNNVALSGVLGGDAANVRLNTNGYTANFTSAGAGTGVGVTVSGLTLSGTAAGNYTLTQPSGLSADITALGVTITSGLSANSKPYDGTTAATISSNNVALSGVLGGDAANVRLNTNGYTANFTSAAAGTGVGVTVSGLTLSGTAAGNYTLTQPSGLSANITALGVTITSGLSANSKPYDGTTAATISSNNVALSGVLGGDAANVRLNTNGYTANFTSAAAGTGIGVTVSGLTLSGTAAGNYTLTQPSGLSANITALGVTITSGLSANSKPYDGTATATISSNNVALSGVLGGDAANVRLNTNGYTANFTSAGAGTGVGVTVSGLTLSGTAAGNYTLTQPSGLSANITALGVTITSGLSANSKPYDGTATATISSNNVALSGVLGGDAANVRLNTNGYTANFTSAGAGTGVGVTVSGLTLSGTAAGNYTLTQPSGLSADITALGVTITSGLSANSKPYDGTATATISSNNVALSGVLGGDAANVRLNTNGYTANFTSAGAGTGVGVTVSGLTLSGTAAGNYTLTQPSGLSADITALGVTITSGLSANSKPYDGTATATISSNNVALSGVLGGDAANVRLNTNGYTANFTSAAAGTGVGVTVSGLTLSGTAAGNYTLTQPSGLSADITALGVTITSGLSANSKPYDGTTAATISSNNVALSGVLGGDAANVRLNTNGYTANFTSAAAGTGVGVTVSGLTLSGTAAGNYTLTQPSGLSADITALGVTIKSIPLPVITSIQLTGGTATITWNSVGGGIYRVQSIDNLSSTNWNDLVPDVTATGATAVQTDIVTGVSQRFYRIKVLNPGITANSKVYDGTTTATISSTGVVLLGVLASDAANVRLNTNGYTANFVSANVGTGIAVTVSGLTLGGSSAGNYTLTQPGGLTANITPAILTVSAVNKSRTYGLPNSLTVSYSGFVHSEGTNVLIGAPALSTRATTNSPPGTYPILVSAGTLNTVNYAFAFIFGTLTVMAAPQLGSVTLNGSQLVFSYPTIANQTYQILYKDDLNAAMWLPLGPAVPGTGGPIIVTNGLNASPHRFFRLVISP